MKLCKCPCCGHYEVSDQDVKLGWIPEPRHLLSAFLRERFERTKLPYTFADRGASKRFPTDLLEAAVSEKLNRALLRVADLSPAFGSPSTVDHATDWPLAQARNPAEFGRMIGHWLEAGALQRNSSGPGFMVTGPGWKLVEELRPMSASRSSQAFVAMSFATEFDSLYEASIRGGLAGTGWSPWRADREQYAEKICDRIVLEIRRSGLMIVECTGHRTNVYFEAGLGMGLGMPIIWCAREDAMPGVAFDVRQYPHIVWKEPDELKSKLHHRVQALYPRT
ncbi:MAG: hypothetical protein HOP15_01370 [Planctomycetes bacterium]|nr:hypothetical protein [Planctomycetota bacterium]